MAVGVEAEVAALTHGGEVAVVDVGFGVVGPVRDGEDDLGAGDGVRLVVDRQAAVVGMVVPALALALAAAFGGVRRSGALEANALAGGLPVFGILGVIYGHRVIRA
jgi:hypothetical protein